MKAKDIKVGCALSSRRSAIRRTMEPSGSTSQSYSLS